MNLGTFLCFTAVALFIQSGRSGRLIVGLGTNYSGIKNNSKVVVEPAVECDVKSCFSVEQEVSE